MEGQGKEVDRRAFLKEMGTWSLGLLVGGAALEAESRAGGFASSGFGRPALPGACIQPLSATEKTLAAVLDTVVPGKDTDPDGDPGALEACAMNLMVDEYYPFRGFADLFAALFDQLSEGDQGKPFVDLDYDQRLGIVVKVQHQMPLLKLAYKAIRSAFYGGSYNGVGLDYLGYPGPNLGYRHVAECSFRKPVCQEMTDEGWMP